MKTEKTIKKGIFALIRESLSKTGGCCGSGQSCCTPAPTAVKESPKPGSKPVEPQQK